MFKIPKVIKIGGRLIPIIRTISSDMDGRQGSYSPWTGKIKLANDSDASKEQEGISLIHEILEQLNEAHEYKMLHPVIQGLAENLYQIIVDNEFGKEK